jgi:succinate dehydrogenase (ubiquinone) cytochrome b560 subunit
MIYRLPLIAWSSVTVRFTGIFGSAVVIAIAGTTLLGGSGMASDAVQGVVATHPELVPAAKFAVAWPLTYHWLGNIRHIVWDMTVKGFNNQTMLHTSYGIYAITTALSAAIAIYSLPPAPPKDQKK